MSIATAITDLQGRIEDAYTALQAKGATIPATKNTYNLPTTIGTIQAGGTTSAEKKDVNFIDYNGTILHSYTKAEAQELTALPTLPTHTGLTCQGWNYTLAEMKSCVSDVGTCCVGAMYTTDDGKTRLKITIPDKAYSTVPLVISQTNLNGVQVDWGDGSQVETSTTTGTWTFSHTYAPSSYPATYTIKLNVASGTMSFPSNIFGKSGTESATNPISAWCGMLEEVNIGDNVTNLGYNAFNGCVSLKSISIPNGVGVGSYVFQGCASLQSITVPRGVTGTLIYTFDGCRSLSLVSIPSTIRAIGMYSFGNCISLNSITIPMSFTSISSYAFNECASMKSIVIPSTTSSVQAGAFASAKALASVKIRGTVQNIPSMMFQNCYGLRTLDCSNSSSVPTLPNMNAFANTSDDMKIIVPTALYDTWKEATNWSNYASRIVMANPSIAFKATQANSTICLNKVGNPDAINIEYLDSNGTWTPYVIGTTLTLANVDDVVYMRCPSSTTQNLGLDESNYHQFTMTGGISAEGNVTFLNNVDGSINMALLSTNAYCYYKLFSGCAALVNAPKLPTGGDYMATGAFAYMFEGCTGLTALPPNFQDMFATIRSENLYKGMFKGCTGLTSVELPFINLSTVQQYPATGCFDEMFMGCSSLDEIILAYIGNFDTDHFNDWVKNVSQTGTIYYNGTDTTVGDYAIPTGWRVSKVLYDGFAVEAREANSTVSIVNESSAPTLSLQYSTNEGITWSTFTVGSTTVTLANVGDRVCFRGTNTKWGGSSNNSRNRFTFTGKVAVAGNINSLLDTYNYNTLLNLSSGRDRVFQYLFYGETGLVDAENLVMPATSIGPFYCNDMFGNCTNLVNPPKELPATYISGTMYAYSGMFKGCTSLVKSPYIRITNVPNNAMIEMFNNCSSLQEIKIDYTGGFGTAAFNNWVNGVPSTGTFYYNGSTTTRGASYIPSGWTITTFSA